MDRVVVAMSGGVDSSVTAGLMVERGYDVVGVHMKLHDAEADQAGRCCGTDDALDARAVADRLGIPFHVMDLREAFRKAVIEDLVDTYVSGATPNPCIQCNGVLKFRVLLRRALALGARYLATGHYARIEGDRLYRAVDTAKDQSYFLFPLTVAALERTRFPLGGLTKAEVRGHAQRMGLVTADKPESQEICFIPDQDHAGFIARERPELDGAGDIVDESGRVLGRHGGYWRYTIGQRRGLGVASGGRLYVSRIEPETRRVVVAGAEGLMKRGLIARAWTWHDRPEPGAPVLGRIRHKGGQIPCAVYPDSSDPRAARVLFDEPVWGISPGQAVVIYRGEQVLGGGWIRRAIEEEAG